MVRKEIVLKCIIDDRENSLMETFDKRNEAALNQADDKDVMIMDYECRRIDIADIVVTDQIGVERKGKGESNGAHDFTSSIKDGRLKDQLERLKEAYEVPIIILERFERRDVSESNIHPNALFSFIAKVAEMGIGLIPTFTIEQTAIAIERLAYRSQVREKASVEARSCPKGMTLEEQRAFMLEGMINTGAKTAKELIKTFTTPENVIKAIRMTKVVYTRTGNPKGIEGPLKLAKIRGVGPKFVLENKKLLFDVEEEFNVTSLSSKSKQKTLI